MFVNLVEIIICSGTLFSVVVLSHRFKINDAIIGAIACVFDILAALCYVFVSEPWQLFTSKYEQLGQRLFYSRFKI